MDFITRKNYLINSRTCLLKKPLLKKVFWVLSLNTCLSAIGAEISDPSTLLSASAQGRAGATAASSQYQDALFQNPASAAFTKRYAVTASYLGWGDSLAATIVDTQSGPVGGGVYYVRRDLSQAQVDSPSLGNYQRSEEHMGFALLGKLAENIGVGTNIRYVYRKSEVFGNAAEWNFDIGLKFQPSPFWSLGIVGQNMLEDKIGVYPKRFVGALEISPVSNFKLSGQMFRVNSDNIKNENFTLPNETTAPGYAVGGEFLTPFLVVIRAGYSESPNWNSKLASAGLGYAAANFALDYSYQQTVSGAQTTTHSLSLTGYF